MSLQQSQKMRSKIGAILISAASTATSQSTSTPDGRKINRCSSFRKKHSNREKACIVDKYENACGNLTVAEWAREINLGKEYEKFLGKSKTVWRNETNMKNVLEKAASDQCKNMKHSTSGNKCKKITLPQI